MNTKNLNELKYKALAANINRQELNSTASRLKEVFSRDEVEKTIKAWKNKQSRL